VTHGEPTPSRPIAAPTAFDHPAAPAGTHLDTRSPALPDTEDSADESPPPYDIALQDLLDRGHPVPTRDILRNSMRGTAPPLAARQARAASPACYEAASEHRLFISRRFHGEMQACSPPPPVQGTDVQDARRAFFSQWQWLLRDALAHVTAAPRAPRGPVPGMPLHATTKTVIENLLRAADGLIIGKVPHSVSAQKFLIDNMAVLADEGVKTLYVGNFLTDLHAPLLREMGSGDQDSPLEPDKVNGIEHVARTACRHGITLAPLDCTTSFMSPGIRLPLLNLYGKTRLTMLNYFAHRVIEADQQSPKAGKWVALVDQEIMRNHPLTASPGLSEMTGAFSLRLDEPPRSKARAKTRIARPHDCPPRSAASLADVTLNMPPSMLAPQPAKVRKTRGVMDIAQRDATLPKRHFYVHHTADTASIRYRNAFGNIEDLPIERNEQGRYFIFRPRSPKLHQVPFRSVNALVAALEKNGLKRHLPG
jgi:hypothetical protein